MSAIIHSLSDFYQYDFLMYALLGTVLISFTCGLISPLLIAKKNAFMGTAISHSTLLGLAIAVSLFSSDQSFSIYITTLCITLFATLFLAQSTYRQKLPNDSLIGIFYTSTMAFGIIIHSLFSKSQGDLLSFLFGNILLLTTDDLILSLALTVMSALLIIIPLKKWQYIVFDEDGALSDGVNVKLFHYVFFILLALLIVTSIKLAGTILIETLLLVPGYFALKFASNMRQTFIFSTLFSVIFSVIGIVIANAFSLPSGATLAATLFTALIIALFVSLLVKKVYNK